MGRRDYTGGGGGDARAPRPGCNADRRGAAPQAKLAAMDFINDTMLVGFAVALGCGLLIGIERERRQRDEARHALAGVRTFTLAALAGAMAHALGQPALVAVGAAFIAAVGAIAYWRDTASDPGVTTELALFVTFLLGVTAVERPIVAAGASVIVASLLYARNRLHRFSTDILTADELRDALILAGAVLVVLPLIPSHPVEWLAGINPRRLWGLVVLMMALQGAGHVALRIAGARVGLPLSGLASGFISSTATIAAMGTRARAEPALRDPCVAGAVFSTIATILQVGLIALAVYPTALKVVGPSVVLGLIAAAVAALAALPRGPVSHDPVAPSGRAFSVNQALIFGGLLSGVTAAVNWANTQYGGAAVGVGAALAGFADAHAAVASAYSLAAGGRIDDSAILLPALIGLSTNTISKFVAAWVAGGKAYAWRVGVGLLAVLAAVWAPWIVQLW